MKIFAEEEIKNFAGLFNILKKVHIRLMKEGRDYKDSKLIPPDKAKSTSKDT
jgi:hypothetical protein